MFILRIPRSKRVMLKGVTVRLLVGLMVFNLFTSLIMSPVLADEPGEPDGSWTECASEGTNCSFPGTKEVRLWGTGTNYGFISRVFTDSTACTVAAFGKDPTVGTIKRCYYRDVQLDSGVTAVVSGLNNKVTFTFHTYAIQAGTLDELKSKITVKKTGAYAYTALGAEDTVVIPTSTATSSTLEINFKDPLVGTENSIQIAPEAFKDINGQPINISVSSFLTVLGLGPDGSVGWTECAQEGIIGKEYCSFSGRKEVRYWHLQYPYGFYSKFSTNRIGCARVEFTFTSSDGSEPKRKCYYRDIKLDNAVKTFIAADSKTVTVTFNVYAMQGGTLEELKSKITVKRTDASAYTALGTEDIVANPISTDTSSTLEIIFKYPLVGLGNSIQIAPEAFKDINGQPIDIPITFLVVGDTPDGSLGWSNCAAENGYCSFSGLKEVRFWGTREWYSPRLAYKFLANGTACTQSIFGTSGNPFFGLGAVNKCYYRDLLLDEQVKTVVSGFDNKVTFTFQSYAKQAGTLEELKSMITVKKTGDTAYRSLGTEDIVANLTSTATSSTLEISFKDPLVGSENFIQIASGAFRDSNGQPIDKSVSSSLVLPGWTVASSSNGRELAFRFNSYIIQTGTLEELKSKLTVKKTGDTAYRALGTEDTVAFPTSTATSSTFVINFKDPLFGLENAIQIAPGAFKDGYDQPIDTSVLIKLVPNAPDGSTGWTNCSAENENCIFSGIKEVRFWGIGTPSGFRSKISVTYTGCNASSFGNIDPAPGTIKRCFHRDVQLDGGVTAVVSELNNKVTFTFRTYAIQAGTLDELKSKITVKKTGDSAYTALGAEDTVANLTSTAYSSTLEINLKDTLVGSENSIRIAPGAFKDSNGQTINIPISSSLTLLGLGPDGSIGWTDCAADGEQCSFNGRKEVRYWGTGAPAIPANYGFISNISTGGTNCPFDSLDPAPGTIKRCYYRDLQLDSEMTAVVSGADNKVTITFRRYAMMVGTLAELKSKITVKKTGASAYEALDTEDTVESLTTYISSTLEINFKDTLVGSENSIQIAPGAFKDIDGKPINISISSPFLTLVPIAPALTNAATPSIGTQPTYQTVNEGDSAPLNVAATVSDSGTLSYQWYSNTTSSNSGGAAISGATSTLYAAPTTTTGTTYYYVVVTNTNNSATGSQTAAATSNVAKLTVNAAVISAPLAPTGLTAIAGNGQIALTWNGVSETVTYSVYEGTASGTYGLNPIVTVSGVTYSYTATGLTNGATYYFAIKASNARGNSNYSNEVSATPIAATPSASSNANLSSIAISGITFSPSFDPGTLSYNVSVANGVTLVTVTPTTSDSNAAVKVNGMAVTSGQSSGAISLNVGNNPITVAVTAQDGMTMQTYTVNVTRAEAITASSSAPIQVTTEPVSITVPASVTNVEIVVATTTAGSSKEATLPLVEVQAATTLGNVGVMIPDGTKITAPANWDGTIKLPQVLSNSSVTINNGIVSAVIEVGSTDVSLTFDRAVRLLIPNQGGKKAGFVRNGVFTEITGTITADTQTAADNEIAAGRDAKITIGNDLVIWTKHFTPFVSYTQVDPTSNIVTSGGGGGGGGAETNSATIAAASGGTTTLNGATIEVPTGAMDSNIQVTVHIVSDTSILPMGSALQLVSEVYEIKKDKDGQFSKPVVITLPFDKTKVDFAKLMAGVYWLNEQTHEWVSLDSLKVDEGNGTASGSVNHFTKFAVLALDIAKNTQPQTNEADFADIIGHWSEANVRELVKLGAINGYPDNTFMPDASITRAEFVTVIVKAFQLGERDGKTFADTERHWAKSAIATVAAAGIVAGYNDNSFGPDDFITREQMAAIVVRAAKLAATDKSVNFPDSADISDWARTALATATAKGMINGYEDGTVKPKVNTTRAEAVTVILRALQAKK